MPQLKLQKGGSKISRAGKYKATKITAIFSNNQIQCLSVEAGGRHDTKACDSIIPFIPETEYLTADKGYDSQKLRRKLRYRKIKPLIPRRQWENGPLRRTPKPILYKQRWEIEKEFSRYDQFRKLTVRYERNPYTYKSYWELAAAFLVIQKLTG